MKTWDCYARVVGSKFLGTVEAETAEEAKQKAWDLPTAYISLCHECAGEVDPDIDDIDVFGFVSL